MQQSNSSNKGELPVPTGLSALSAATVLSSLTPVPDHELLRRIGRGTFGEVWLARNMMGVYRAVKIVYRTSFVDEQPFQRELAGVRNFEPISRSHEGFVDVLHAGLDEKLGLFYYVMELGDDVGSGQRIDPENYTPKTLSRSINSQRRLSPEETLRLGLALSLALSELHKNGLVHRDVKPSNIIFVNGVPKLADIGLVTGVTDAASFAGTEGFIPPEGPGLPQADVYGLGKVLYEACTGFDRLKFPDLPKQLELAAPDHNLFLELNEVILEACQGAASKRFSSAWEMHARLLVIANGGSVRRLRTLERKWASLKRGAGIAALASLALGGYGLLAFRQYQNAREARQKQVVSKVVSYRSFGSRALDAGDLLGSLPYFAEALRLDQGNEHAERLYRLRLGSARAQSPKLVQMWFLSGVVGSVGFSPTGDRVLAIPRQGKAQVFDLGSGRPISPPFGTNMLWRGGFSPDGNFIATAGQDGTACVWNLEGSKVFQVIHSNAVLSAGFSPDGRFLITGCDDNLVRLWDWRTGDLRLELRGHTGHIRHAAFNRQGNRIVTAGEDNTARIWDASDGHPLLQLPHPGWVMYAAFSPDSQVIATACSDHKVRFWNASSGERIGADLKHLDGVSSVEFSPDDRIIATAGLDSVVRLWEADTHEPLRTSPVLRHSDRVLHVVFSPDGSRLASACDDGTVRIWDLAGAMVAPRAMRAVFSEDRSCFLTLTNGCVQVWQSHSGQPLSPPIRTETTNAVLSQDGRFILMVAADKDGRRMVQIRKAETGNQIGPPIPMSNELTNLALTKDGKRLLSISGHTINTWDVASGNPLARFSLPMATNQSAVWDPSGEFVAGWSGYLVKVWNGVSGQNLFTLTHPVPVTHAEFSLDGSRLLTCVADSRFTKCSAQVWNARTGQAVGSPMKHHDGVLCSSFSPDGKRVATGSKDFSAAVWDSETGARITPSVMHEEKILSATFSPDGLWFITAGVDQRARVWSAETGDPLTPWLVHLENLWEVRFVGDATRVVTSDHHGNSWIWKLEVDQRPVEDLMTLARLLSGDTITPWGQANAQEKFSLEAAWRQMRARYPTDFATTPQEVCAWHEFQAEESEHAEDWAAAVLHLKQCLALSPNDSYLAEHLAEAKKHLPTAKP